MRMDIVAVWVTIGFVELVQVHLQEGIWSLRIGGIRFSDIKQRCTFRHFSLLESKQISSMHTKQNHRAYLGRGKIRSAGHIFGSIQSNIKQPHLSSSNYPSIVHRPYPTHEGTHRRTYRKKYTDRGDICTEWIYVRRKHTHIRREHIQREHTH